MLEFLRFNYEIDKIKDNIIFDLKHQISVYKSLGDKYKDNEISVLKNSINMQQKQIISYSSRLKRWELIMNKDFSTLIYPSQVSIYGCGAIGRIFSQKIKNYTKVIEFIDRNPRQNDYQGIPVRSIKDSLTDDNTLIIILPTEYYEEIINELFKNKGFLPKVITIDAFLESARLLDPNF